MNHKKLFLMLSLFVILMTVFGNAFAQDTSLPAFKVSSVVTDEKVVLTTKNFPADTAYTVSMAAEDSDNFTPVAKFNSKNGGSLNVTVKIPAKFQGLNNIQVLVEDADGNQIPGVFVNIPEEVVEEEPAAEEVVEEQPVEEPAADEAVEEQPAEEPAADEAVENTAEEELTISLVNQEPAAEETKEETVEEQPSEETDEEPVVGLLSNMAETAIEEAVEESVEEAVEEVIEKPADEAVEEAIEEAIEEVVEEAVEDAVIEINLPETTPAVVCDYSIIPTVIIDAVQKDSTVTFTTSNFPANSTFSVSMGVYVESWTPVMPQPRPQPVPAPIQQRVPNFNPIDNEPAAPAAPDHGPEWRRDVTFKGTQAGTFETGDGSSQTLTFEIPADVKGIYTIALWVSDLGECGFYSYNYFYNVSTN